MADAQDKDRLVEEIARQQACHADLERERELIQVRLRALKAGLDGLSSPSVPGSVTRDPMPIKPTGMQKVRLFRELFRGREDVFATRFVSKKTGKPSYAPACANTWVSGVCGLPHIKCGECTPRRPPKLPQSWPPQTPPP